jgi:hypothetical protein
LTAAAPARHQHRGEHALKVSRCASPLLVAEQLHLQVGPCAKGSLARAGEHDATVPLLGLDAGKEIAELERRPGVEGVGDFRAVERHQKDVVGPVLRQQRFVFPLHSVRRLHAVL